jgi:hypothetical protein
MHGAGGAGGDWGRQRHSIRRAAINWLRLLGKQLRIVACAAGSKREVKAWVRRRRYSREGRMKRDDGDRV